MFSQTVEYALRAVVCLADRAPSACTTEEIAVATKVPKPYLSKVLQALVRHKIARSQRGIGGGITLIKTPDQLTLFEIVNAIEPIARIETCPLGLKSHGKQLCPLHKRLDEAAAVVQKSFEETTLSDLLSAPKGVYPLCESPKSAGLAEGVQPAKKTD